MNTKQFNWLRWRDREHTRIRTSQPEGYFDQVLDDARFMTRRQILAASIHGQIVTVGGIK